MRGLAVPQGLFVDKAVTGAPWRGQQRRTRMVIYRYVNPNAIEPFSPEEQLNQVCERLCSALLGAGITTVRQRVKIFMHGCYVGLILSLIGSIKRRSIARQPMLTLSTVNSRYSMILAKH